MSLVTLGTAFVVLMLLASVMLGWVADLRRAGGSISARESRARAEDGRAAFYTSREARAAAMRERIQRERRRRERARAAARAARARTEAGPQAPRPDRPSVPAQETPEMRHRATLELPPGTVTMETVRAHYRRLVAGYHPDRVVGLGAKLRRLAEEETKAINEAYAFFKRRLGD